MSDQWADEAGGDGDLGLGSIDLPAVAAPPPPPEPKENAWTAARGSSDVRAKPAGQPVRDLRGAPPVTGGVPEARAAFARPSAGGGDARGGSFGGAERGGGGGGSQESTLYCVNLPFETDENGIAAHFSAFGANAGSIQIQRHSDTGNIKAALVKLPNAEAANAAVLELNERDFGGRSVRVKIDGSDRGSRGGGGGGYGGGGGAGPPGYDGGGGGRLSLIHI